jgi:pyridinium-3,5-biscarboxylic acid mononucleotide sulfurtransferase
VNIDEKYQRLQQFISGLGKAAVAFSGGVDSSFLSKVAHDVLGDQAMAITVVSPMLPKSELDGAKELAADVGITHVLVEDNDIEEEVAENPVNRCYYCKKVEFSTIQRTAAAHSIKYVLDGSNLDDMSDYRPGLHALEELAIASPLREVGLTKDEIRELSRRLGLKTWDKPAYACLASRIPYGERITENKLSIVEKAEDYLRETGFRQFRVRSHGDIARIEVAADEREKLFSTATMDEISLRLKSIGFLYVCVELEGYRMGNLNRALKASKGDVA